LLALRSKRFSELNKFENLLPLSLYRREPKLVVLVCLARTGSNHLLSTLGYHPQNVSFYELFHRKAESRTNFYQHQYLDGADPIEFIEMMRKHRFRRKVRTFCFKLIYSQALNPKFRSAWHYLLADPDVSFIHLYRRNGLERLVSFKTAQNTKIWVKRDDNTPAVEKLNLNPQKCLRYFEKCQKQSETIKEALKTKRSIELSYEELTSNKLQTITRITEFLGLRPKYNKRLKEATKVQRQGSLRDRISNYDELYEFFRNSKYSSYFE
jgi:LPS sulfotransferase NodH